jgi:iron(III) transport system ATP-binding protein
VIVAEGLFKRYDSGEPVLHGVSFQVAPGEVFTLLGPSGCGKTTSLRCVAGLEIPEAGDISLGDRVMFSSKRKINVPADRRNIGMVFQSYAIWPHMTVAENVAYPLEGRKISAADLKRRVAETLELVGLGALGDRPSPYLSGGQQQRVALARAIVGEPSVLLLDEPLSNLDAKLREQMRRELTSLQKRLGHTALYVTHDQEEALALSHKIALMRNGEIVEQGDPTSMFQRPRHPFTAGFLGLANFVGCRVNGIPRDGERVEVDTSFGRFAATARPGEGDKPQLFFRPHNARLGQVAGGSLNCGNGRVSETTFLGDMVDIFVRNDTDTVRLRADARMSPGPGAELRFATDAADCIAFIPGLRAA